VNLQNTHDEELNWWLLSNHLCAFPFWKNNPICQWGESRENLQETLVFSCFLAMVIPAAITLQPLTKTVVIRITIVVRFWRVSWRSTMLRSSSPSPSVAVGTYRRTRTWWNLSVLVLGLTSFKNNEDYIMRVMIDEKTNRTAAFDVFFKSTLFGGTLVRLSKPRPSWIQIFWFPNSLQKVRKQKHMGFNPSVA
jgi:hypothetical protein